MKLNFFLDFLNDINKMTLKSYSKFWNGRGILVQSIGRDNGVNQFFIENRANKVRKGIS
jgi:hypothetical protein